MEKISNLKFNGAGSDTDKKSPIEFIKNNQSPEQNDPEDQTTSELWYQFNGLGSIINQPNKIQIVA